MTLRLIIYTQNPYESWRECSWIKRFFWFHVVFHSICSKCS